MGAAENIAEQKMRINGHDALLAKHEQHLARLDEAIALLKEAHSELADKEDIRGLHVLIEKKFGIHGAYVSTKSFIFSAILWISLFTLLTYFGFHV
jgi:hypothetical protein